MHGGTARSVHLFLGDSAATHTGPERLSDLLASPSRFVPANDAAGGNITWLNTANLIAVRAAHESEEDSIESERRPIDVVLTNGATCRGLVTFARSDVRMTELLNDSDHPFLRLIEKDHLLFINRQHIARVLTPEI